MERGRSDDLRCTCGRGCIALDQIARHIGHPVPHVRCVLQALIDQGAIRCALASHDGRRVLIRADDQTLQDFYLELREAVKQL